MDGVPVSVNEFMDAVDARFASSFDILGATLRGSTKIVGIRTITRWHEEWRRGIKSSSQLIRYSISIEMLPIYDSSSWSFSIISGLFESTQVTYTRLTQEQINALRSGLTDRLQRSGCKEYLEAFFKKITPDTNILARGLVDVSMMLSIRNWEASTLLRGVTVCNR